MRLRLDPSRPTWQRVLHDATLVGLALCGLIAVCTVAYVVIFSVQFGS